MFLLREVEMVSQLNTRVEVTELIGVRMRSGQYIQFRYGIIRRSCQVEQTFGVRSVLECIEYAVVRICTQTERVTGLEDPLVTDLSGQHDVDVELDTVLLLRLLAGVNTGHRLVNNRDAGLLEYRGDMRIVLINRLLVRCVNRDHELRTDVEEQAVVMDQGEHYRYLQLELVIGFLYVLNIYSIVHVRRTCRSVKLRMVSIFFQTTLVVTDTESGNDTEVHRTTVLSPVVSILEIEHI